MSATTAYGGAIYGDEGSGNISVFNNVCSGVLPNWLYLHVANDISAYNNYSDTTNQLDDGTNCSISGLMIVTQGHWPDAALSIMNAAGVQD